MNIRGQTSLTKTGILLVIIVFYSTLFIVIGYINSYFNTEVDVQTTNAGFGNSGSCDCGVITCAEYRLIHGETALQQLCEAQATSEISFTQNIIRGIGEIPFWLNTIIFTTLILVIAWILLSSLPTFNGGG